MAGVTLNQIATEVAGEQGERKDDTSFITQCETWLKDAIIEIDSEGNFKIFKKPLSVITAVGTSLYDLPEDFRTIKFIRHPDTDEHIDYINPSTLVSYGIDLEQAGRPRNHWVTDPRVNAQNQFIQRLKLHPVPNAIFNLDGEYYFDVINLTTGSIIPLIPQAILALKSRLRMHIHESDKEWTAYNVARSQYSKDLAAFLRQETVKPHRRMKKRVSDISLGNRRPTRLRYPFE